MIDAGGDNNINFTVAGEMYIMEIDAYTINLATAGVYVQLDNFHKGKDTDVLVDEVNGTFTIQFDGTYKFDVSASIYPGSGMTVYFTGFKNGIRMDNIDSGINFKNSQTMETLSSTGLFDAKKGDVITMRAKSDTSSITFDISHMNMNIIRKGN